MKKINVLLFSSLLFGAIVSCNNNNGGQEKENQSFTVEFITNGGILSVESMEIDPSNFTSLPTPTKGNATFLGWFTDEALTQEFDINNNYTGTIKVYAAWEESDLIKISTIDEFLAMEMNGHYELANNLDFNGTTITPIGTKEAPFSGLLDGKNFTISNFNVENGEFNSLFGYVTGELKNIFVKTDFNIDVSSSSYVGLLASHAYQATITSCYAKGNITLNSTSEEEPSLIGGLIGYSEVSNVSKCFTSTNINVTSVASSFVGGVIGYNGGGTSQESVVSSSFSKNGTIYVSTSGSRTSSYSGGVVGYNFGLVDKCFSHDLNITAKSKDYYCFVGGVVADNNGGRVSNCFGASNVTTINESGNSFRGLVVGRNFKSTEDENNGTMFNCFGSSIAISSYSVPTKYAQLTSHEQVVVDYVTLDELKTKNWYENTLNFSEFNIKDNYYPALNSEFKKINYTATSGTYENPILISTNEELMNMDTNKAYKLNNDLDLSGVDYKTKGTYFDPFRGSFDGNGHSIKGLSITKQGSSLYNGLFGYVNGLIKNLTIEFNANYELANSNINYVGSLAGYAVKSLIKNCKANVNTNIATHGLILGGLVGYLDTSTLIYSSTEGSLKGNSSTDSSFYGGLVGESFQSEISNCFNKANLECAGENVCYIGGIIGKNYGSIDSVYSIGNIKALDGNNIYLGGLAGLNKKGSITNSYASSTIENESEGTLLAGGLVGLNNATLNNCFYAVNEEIKYSSGHSPLFVNVTRVDSDKLNTIVDQLGANFYLGNDNLPHLYFEQGGTK